jgi:DNA-binding NtrC family response regulator
MSKTAYVIEPDPGQQAWIESSLARSVDAVVFVDDGGSFLANIPGDDGVCLIASAEPDAAATLELVRELRSRGATLPVIVLGPHSAFRTAVDIARLDATDFLERPVSVHQLCAAVRKALNAGT